MSSSAATRVTLLIHFVGSCLGEGSEGWPDVHADRAVRVSLMIRPIWFPHNNFNMDNPEKCRQHLIKHLSSLVPPLVAWGRHLLAPPSSLVDTSPDLYAEVQQFKPTQDTSFFTHVCTHTHTHSMCSPMPVTVS